MDKIEQMIKDCLDSWSKSRTFDYTVLHDCMYQTVLIFQEANGNILEDLLVNAFYSTPGLFHYLIEVNEIGKALSDKYTMLSNSVSLSSVYSSVLLNFLEGPLKHVLLCILYALKKRTSPKLTFKNIYEKDIYLGSVIEELQSKLKHYSKETVLSSIFIDFMNVKLRFVRNKVAHHDYYIVTGKKNENSVYVKGIMFIDKHDVNSPSNFYLEINKLGRYIRWVENLIVILISSIDIFIKTSLENRRLRLEEICKKCNDCGSWKVDFSMEFLDGCKICSQFKTIDLKKKAIRLKIGGPEIINAVQEAVDAGMDLVTIPEYEKQTGELVRLGYYLVEKGKPSRPPVARALKLKWIKKEDLVITREETDLTSHEPAKFEVTYNIPKKKKE